MEFVRGIHFPGVGDVKCGDSDNTISLLSVSSTLVDSQKNKGEVIESLTEKVGVLKSNHRKMRGSSGYIFTSPLEFSFHKKAIHNETHMSTIPWRSLKEDKSLSSMID